MMMTTVYLPTTGWNVVRAKDFCDIQWRMLLDYFESDLEPFLFLSSLFYENFPSYELCMFFWELII